MSIAVSDLWKTNIESRFRNQGYLRFAVEVVAPGLREGSTVTSDSTNLLTSVDVLRDGIVNKPTPVALCEKNRWSLTGDIPIAPSKEELYGTQPWWDNHLVHDDTTYPTLEFTFDKPYDIPGVYGIWDTLGNSWPTKLVMEGYDSDNNLLNTYTITTITKSAQYVDAPLTAAKRVVLKIQGWSNPAWRARCSEIVFGVHFDFDGYRIFSATSASRVSITSEELPKYGMTVVVGNYDDTFDPLLEQGYSKYLKAKQKATWQWGFKLADGSVEWAAEQPMFLTSVTIPSTSPTLTMNFGSRLDFMTNVHKKDSYDGSSRTFGALARSILDNTDLIKQNDTEVPYSLDAILDTLSTSAPLPKVAENVLLQYIAGATGCVLTTDPATGYVSLQRLGERTARNITQAQATDPAVELEQELYTISINVYQYTPEAGTSQVCSGNYLLAGQTTVFIEHETALGTSAAVTGGTLNSATYYAQGASLTITPTDVNTPVNVSITGYKVKATSTLFETYRNSALGRGLEIVVDNPLITEVGQLSALTTILQNYYMRRQTLTIPYTGYPELLGGDLVRSTSKYGDITGDLLEHTITYDPGWKGTAVIRGSKSI